MTYGFDYRVYQRPFRQPLLTHHGLWEVREGIVLKLTNDRGQVAYGEIAPLPWFGSETLEQAIHFCRQLPGQLSEATLFSIMPTLPACQFGFETVFKNLNHRRLRHAQVPAPRCAALLPTGEAALSAWQPLWSLGHRTFKWKIGVAPLADELRCLEALLGQMPLGSKIRLDANGGLDELTARHWLDWCDRTNHRIEYIEQPLPPDQFSELLKLSRRYQTPIALDESIASLEQLKTYYYRGWQGIYILKAAIIGSPHRLKQFCHHHPIDGVISSVFETAIGRQAVIDLAMELQDMMPHTAHRAMGLGTAQWLPSDGFNDGFNPASWDHFWQQLS
ncbi:MAG: o-succinylbenzoate synthase [Cyanobacteria bacterium P01_A01_bin.105]